MLEDVRAYKCESCGGISENCIDESLYECPECGNRFTRSNGADGDSHRCPNDYKFSSKVAEQACESCGEGEVEEIDAIHCTVCDSYFEQSEIENECPNCKEAEVKKQELDRLAKLPLDQRGGQTTFKTREEAEEAFEEFLASVGSEVIKVIPAHNYSLDLGDEERNGVGWKEFPKPVVSFRIELSYNLPQDKYISEYASQPCYLTDEFFEDVDKAVKQFLRASDKKLKWNNTRSCGWLCIEK